MNDTNEEFEDEVGEDWIGEPFPLYSQEQEE